MAARRVLMRCCRLQQTPRCDCVFFSKFDPWSSNDGGLRGVPILHEQSWRVAVGRKPGPEPAPVG
jgi:hypothetical protein